MHAEVSYEHHKSKREETDSKQVGQLMSTGQMRDDLAAAGVKLPSHEDLTTVSILFNSWLEELHHDKGLSHVHWLKLFKEVDVDGSGTVTYNELNDVVRIKLKKSRRVLSDSELQAVWCALDVDGSNTLTTDEMANFFRRGMGAKGSKATKPKASTASISLAERRGLPPSCITMDAPMGASGPDSQPKSSSRRAALWRERLGGVVSVMASPVADVRRAMRSLRKDSKTKTDVKRNAVKRRTTACARPSAMTAGSAGGASMASSIITVITEVASEEEAARVPIWRQGGEEFYTEEALQARVACRQNAAVLSVLDRWWQAALRSLASAGDGVTSDGGISALDKARYVPMMRKIYKASARPCCNLCLTLALCRPSASVCGCHALRLIGLPVACHMHSG